jgi:hypothetical protein
VINVANVGAAPLIVRASTDPLGVPNVVAVEAEVLELLLVTVFVAALARLATVCPAPNRSKVPVPLKVTVVAAGKKPPVCKVPPLMAAVVEAIALVGRRIPFVTVVAPV